MELADVLNDTTPGRTRQHLQSSAWKRGQQKRAYSGLLCCLHDSAVWSNIW